jgi:ribonuclease R
VKDRVGEEFSAKITGVTENGLFVAFDQPFVEARIPVERLGEDYYELDRLGIRLVGRRSGHAFALGDALTVRLEAVAIDRREIVAVPATLPEGRRARRTHPPRSPSPKKQQGAKRSTRPPRKQGQTRKQR